MTISKILKDWLSEFTEAEFSEVLTDLLAAVPNSASLFRSPGRITEDFIDGSSQVTDFYNFFGKKSSQLDDERITNDEIFTKLEKTIEERNFNEDLPNLEKAQDKNYTYTCEDVSVSQTTSIITSEQDTAIYQITIKIIYLKEKR